MNTPSHHPDDALAMFAANIPKYFAYVALKGFGFGLFISVWVIYLQERRGLSLSQAALIDATFFVAAAFGEIPTGVVADTLGRKASMCIGALLLSLSAIGWTFAPTLPLIVVAYMAMGLGLTFLSGAEDALFYESLRASGRETDYARLAGRSGAFFTGALAAGSGIGGLLAAIDLVLPYIVSCLTLLTMFGVVLTLSEARNAVTADGQPRLTFPQILRHSLRLMKNNPALRYAILYLAFVPLASLMLEAVFLQPQAVRLGVPIAGIGLLVMAVQLTNMLGSNWSDRIRRQFGAARVIYAAPAIIVGSLLLLAVLQVFPALLFIAVMGFCTAVLRPILLSQIQSAVPDDIRATIISMQSLIFTIVGAVSQPTLGFIAEHAGLPTAYVVLAFSLTGVLVVLFWISRRHFPPERAVAPVQVLEAGD